MGRKLFERQPNSGGLSGRGRRRRLRRIKDKAGDYSARATEQREERKEHEGIVNAPLSMAAGVDRASEEQAVCAPGKDQSCAQSRRCDVEVQFGREHHSGEGVVIS